MDALDIPFLNFGTPEHVVGKYHKFDICRGIPGQVTKVASSLNRRSISSIIFFALCIGPYLQISPKSLQRVE